MDQLSVQKKHRRSRETGYLYLHEPPAVPKLISILARTTCRAMPMRGSGGASGPLVSAKILISVTGRWLTSVVRGVGPGR